MKRGVANIISIFSAVVYLLSTMGYGVHICDRDGSRNIILMFGETPCEYVHSHIDASGHLFTHSHSIVSRGNSLAHSADDFCQDGCPEPGCSCSDASHHGDNCCKTIVFVLSHDQLNSDNSQIHVSDSNTPSHQLYIHSGYSGSESLSLCCIASMPDGKVPGASHDLKAKQELKIQFRV